jgi:hypothetical protein
MRPTAPARRPCHGDGHGRDHRLPDPGLFDWFALPPAIGRLQVIRRRIIVIALAMPMVAATTSVPSVANAHTVAFGNEMQGGIILLGLDATA